MNAAWFNAVQEELARIVERFEPGGLNPADLTQVARVLDDLVHEMWGDVTPEAVVPFDIRCACSFPAGVGFAGSYGGVILGGTNGYFMVTYDGGQSYSAPVQLNDGAGGHPDILSIAWSTARNKFVAVGASGTVWTLAAADLSWAWAGPAAGTGISAHNLNAVAYVPSIAGNPDAWIAVGDDATILVGGGAAAPSTWSAAAGVPGIVANLYGLTYVPGTGTVYACGESDAATGVVIWAGPTTLLTAWTSAGVFGTPLRGLAYGPQVAGFAGVIAVGDGGAIWYQAPGASVFTAAQSDGPSWTAVASMGGLVAVSTEGIVGSSVDGTTWRWHFGGQGFPGVTAISCVAFAPLARWWVAGGAGQVVKSSAGRGQ
jgi:hypothetical protein